MKMIMNKLAVVLDFKRLSNAFT